MTTEKHERLYQELLREQNRMQSGGTSYRQETAQLALMLSHDVKVPESLCNRVEARHFVGSLTKELSEERLEDVAKMLSMAARRSYTNPESAFSIEMKVKLEEKRNRFKARGLRVKSKK
jgi:hypothetical protein